MMIGSAGSGPSAQLVLLRSHLDRIVRPSIRQTDYHPELALGTGGVNPVFKRHFVSPPTWARIPLLQKVRIPQSRRTDPQGERESLIAVEVSALTEVNLCLTTELD